MNEVDHVQSASALSVEFDQRGPQEQGRGVVDNSGPGLPADVRRAGRDHRWGFQRHEFRDARRTAIVIASGPSAERCVKECTADWTDWPTITVNSSWRLNPRADAIYAADGQFWRCRDQPTGLRYIDLIRRCADSCAYTCDARAAEEFRLCFIQAQRQGGISTEADRICTGGAIGNSGAQAINLAYLFGARRLVLVGFDMDHHNGDEHWHGKHPAGLRNDSDYGSFVTGMGALAVDLHKLGVEVINCSPKSKLPYWRKTSLDLALQALA